MATKGSPAWIEAERERWSEYSGYTLLRNRLEDMRLDLHILLGASVDTYIIRNMFSDPWQIRVLTKAEAAKYDSSRYTVNPVSSKELNPSHIEYLLQRWLKEWFVYARDGN